MKQSNQQQKWMIHSCKQAFLTMCVNDLLLQVKKLCFTMFDLCVNIINQKYLSFDSFFEMLFAVSFKNVAYIMLFIFLVSEMFTNTD